MTHHPGLIGAEPKDGDFVAYLREIERRQVSAMHEARLASPPAPQLPAARPTPATAGVRGPAPHASTSHGERPPLNKEQAAAIMDVLSTQRGPRVGVSSQDFVGALIVAFVALVFFLAGATFGNVVPMLIGGGLGWLAFTRLRRAFRGETGDLAERLKRSGFNS